MFEIFLLCLIIAVSVTLGLSLLITIGNREWKKFFYNLKMTSIIVGIAFSIIVIVAAGITVLI